MSRHVSSSASCGAQCAHAAVAASSTAAATPASSLDGLHAGPVQAPANMIEDGEPLNPEVIDQVSQAWGRTIRDGCGQTETSVQIANTPGQPVKAGWIGPAGTGFHVALIDPVSGVIGEEGDVSLDLAHRPTGLMVGYRDDDERTAEVMREGYYHTGDVGSRDAEGYITYVGRADDVFKASDYRISPFELESVLLEHEAVAEAARRARARPAAPCRPQGLRHPGRRPRTHPRDGAGPSWPSPREHLAPYKRLRRVEFTTELPKTSLRQGNS